MSLLFARASRAILLLVSCWAGISAAVVADESPRPLPSWNDGPARTAILDFVARTTTPGSEDYVPPAERIATFDNDGTLWSEQPVYVQLAFAIDRLKQLAPEHPEWRTEEPYRSFLNDGLAALAKHGKKGVEQLLAATHAGMTERQFSRIVTDWLATAEHPRYKRPYTECVYQPMLELLTYLRQHQFKTFIVSGGGIDFMRPWTQQIYGIPPEQVVGSSGRIQYEMVDGQPALMRLAEVDFIDDGPGKPVGIQRHIGRRPIAAFGNSDGDFQMLQWTTSGEGPRLAMIVHHTDGVRETAYDRKSPIGKLDKAFDAAPANGWVVIDMKKDWNKIFAFPSAEPKR
ncbi:MAG: HAD family hydrolase [Blastopirellula sp. JB062]